MTTAIDVQSSALVAFLLARIAEDEAADPDWGFLLNSPRIDTGESRAVDQDACDADQAKWDKRWLAECRAKRQIVERAALALAEMAGKPTGAAVLQALMGGHALGALAAIYADHPDYRDEWKP